MHRILYNLHIPKLRRLVKMFVLQQREKQDQALFYSDSIKR